MPVIKKAGKAGRAKVGAVYPSITKWSVALKSDMQNTTGSDNYDETSEQLWKSQAKGAFSGEGTIEGKYDFDPTNGTAAMIVTAGLFSDDPIPIDLDVDRETTFGYGDFDLSDVEVNLEVEGEITFSAKSTTNGVFKLGARPAPGP